MSKRRLCWAMAVSLGVLAFAERSSPAQDEARGKRQIVVAVLDFATQKKQEDDLASKITDLATVFLSAEDGFQMVERAEIKKLLEEMTLGKSGIVKPEEAARIGYMTGANIIITGNAFIVGDKLYVTAKVIGTETSRMSAVIAKGPLDQDLDVIVQELATKIGEFIREKGRKILPKIVTREERIGRIKERLEGKKLPVFAVAIVEQHVGRATIDPAAQTEIQYILKKCGAELVNIQEQKLATWAKDFLKEKSREVPSSFAKADLIVVGEGFSEFAGTHRNLISVKARVEIQVVHVRTGKILAVGRKSVTAVDLAEQIAGKTALQEAAADVAMTLIPEAVNAYAKLTPEKD